MPFIGVRISWLMAARKRDLARLAASACLRASVSSASERRRSVMSRPRHCTSETAALAGRDGVLLPLEPARAARRLDLLHVALLAQRAAGRQRGCLVAGEHARARTAGRARRCARAPNTRQKAWLTKVRRPSRIAAQDHVRLVVEQIAVARLVLADLPLDVLELLEPPLEALADRHEALELGGKIAAEAGAATPACPRGVPPASRNVCSQARRRPGRALGVGHA